MTLQRAVFLDRDGVINRAVVRDGKPFPPASVDAVAIFEDVEYALSRLRQHGFLLIAVTNQPDVRRGTVSREHVEAINDLLLSRLPIEDFFVCYHDDIDRCDCRKPLPGLLLQAASKYMVDLRASFMVGDRWRDIDAGVAAGCQTILVYHGYNERPPTIAPNHIVNSLSEAVDWIINRCHQ
jgi:D-glycero-D-manno-heptose 1,7-bisphosphate phosphatase